MFQGVNAWFWSKNGHFSNFLFLCNTGQENVFYDILERKNAFLAYKNKKIKRSNNWHFSIRNKPWFWSKNGYFSNFFFLGNKGQENVFDDILERKNAFLGYKNNKFNKSKNWPMNLVQKWPFFEVFLEGQYRPGKWLYDILQRKNNFLGYKNKKIKKSKKRTFFQRE